MAKIVTGTRKNPKRVSFTVPKLFPKKKPKLDDREQAQEQLHALLLRHRLAQPFPIPPEPFVRSLIPSLQSVDPTPEQMSNLNLALCMRHFVHISLDDEPVFDRGDYENVFWLRLPNDVPVPPDILQPFRLWPQHAQWRPVSAWFSDATETDNIIDNLKDGFEAFFKVVGSAAALRVAWPELTKFVRLRGPTLGHVTALQRQAIDNMMRTHIDVTFRKTALRMLAAATLLDAETEPTAWVSFHSE